MKHVSLWVEVNKTVQKQNNSIRIPVKLSACGCGFVLILHITEQPLSFHLQVPQV